MQPRADKPGLVQDGHRPHQETHERVHGVVQDREEKDHGAVAGHAQRGDLQAAGEALEDAQGQREDPVHPRGRAAAAKTHGRLPRLQVQTQEETKARQLQVVGAFSGEVRKDDKDPQQEVLQDKD